MLGLIIYITIAMRRVADSAANGLTICEGSGVNKTCQAYDFSVISQSPLGEFIFAQRLYLFVLFRRLTREDHTTVIGRLIIKMATMRVLFALVLLLFGWRVVKEEMNWRVNK